MTDQNGNQGREYVNCSGSADLPHKSWFRFIDDLQSSPPLQSRPHFPSIPAVYPAWYQPPLDLPSGLPFPPVNKKCGHAACKKTINLKCARRSCANHCRALGGCHLTLHATTINIPAQAYTMSPQPSYRPPNLINPLPMAVSIPSPATLSHPHSPIPPTPVSVSSQVSHTTEPPPSMNALPNPRYASQMHPIFNEQMAIEQTLMATRRAEEAARLDAIKRTKHTVSVCAWVSEGEEPENCVFQEGFIWPNFPLTQSILSDLGFVDGQDNGWIHIYNHLRGSWQKVKVNHVISVDAQPEILIKAINIKACPHLADYLVSQNDAPPHFRNNLQRECESVESKITAQFIEENPATPQPLASRKRVMALEDMSSKRAHFTMMTKPPPLLSHSPPSTPTPHHTFPRPVHLEFSDSGDVQSPAIRCQGSIDDVIDLSGNSLTPRPRPLSRLLKSARHKATKPITPFPKPSPMKKQWPSDFHVPDVIHVLETCKSPPPGFTVRSVFESMVHHPFKSSTYYDAKARWEHADQEDRDFAETCTYRPSGLWSVFAARVPMKHAPLKAACQRHARRNTRSVSRELDDINEDEDESACTSSMSPESGASSDAFA